MCKFFAEFSSIVRRISSLQVTNWLPPLLTRIALNRKTLAIPIVDGIDWNTLGHNPVYYGGILYRGIWEWGFLYKETEIPQRERSAMKYQTEPYKSPTVVSSRCLPSSLTMFFSTLVVFWRSRRIGSSNWAPTIPTSRSGKSPSDAFSFLKLSFWISRGGKDRCRIDRWLKEISSRRTIRIEFQSLDVWWTSRMVTNERIWTENRLSSLGWAAAMSDTFIAVHVDAVCTQKEQIFFRATSIICAWPKWVEDFSVRI